MASGTAIAEQVSSVREFNRYYTSRLGLLRKRHLNGEFSLTEARILYEIGSHPQITASTLCTRLGLDPGYISRLLASFIRRKLIRQFTGRTDGREKPLALTTAGEESVAHLNAQSDAQILGILAGLRDNERNNLVAALVQAHRILAAPASQEIRIVRLSAAPCEALEIVEECMVKLRSTGYGAASAEYSGLERRRQRLLAKLGRGEN